ncbi:mde1 [Acrasis kona]|uniref:Mde1 n=1 Tax=Acrasis kona TaxID=1008807 RepID=A0AAW2YKL2_9EUKA
MKPTHNTPGSENIIPYINYVLREESLEDLTVIGLQRENIPIQSEAISTVTFTTEDMQVLHSQNTKPQQNTHTFVSATQSNLPNMNAHTSGSESTTNVHCRKNSTESSPQQGKYQVKGFSEYIPNKKSSIPHTGRMYMAKHQVPKPKHTEDDKNHP